jgi:23S rRNA (cytidine1920-2'-O)/16S rRNA (cytidine1409-2'-O)-methyltransferase
MAAASGLALQACGLVASPITGPAGNHEYLLWLGQGTCLSEAETMPQDAPGRLVEATLQHPAKA